MIIIYDDNLRKGELLLTPSNDGHSMTRRMYILLMLAMLPRPIRAEMKLGDEDWMRYLHAFITTFNVFLAALDDGRFDHSALQRAQAAWKKLEVK